MIIKKMIVPALTSILLMGYATYAYSETKPQKTQGIDPVTLQHFLFADQVKPTETYELRGRRIVIAPGGTIAEHSHADRPGIVYVIEGLVTEYRNGQGRVMKPGESWAEDAGTIHWIENATDMPAVIWAVDIVKKQ
jgi:quercetin dioxygenase-like cupin family protein